jgi:hypothetical protein
MAESPKNVRNYLEEKSGSHHHPPRRSPLRGREPKAGTAVRLCSEKFKVQGSRFKVRGMLIVNFL